MTSNNVVIFPKGKKDAPPMNMAELMSSISGTRSHQADFLLDDIGSYIFSRAFEEGFDLGFEDNEKCVTLMMETIRACLLNAVGVPHVLQDLAEDCVNFVDEGEE